MNWYKKSQRVYEQDAHNIHYWDIGHIKNQTHQAWAWTGEKIIVSDTHWEMEDQWNKKMYSGRFEDENGVKRVSITVPKDRQFYDVPDSLIQSLKRRYGDDINIYIFNRRFS